MNKNLVDMLQKAEGKDVVLQESNGEAHKADDAELSSSTLEEKVGDKSPPVNKFAVNHISTKI